MAIENFKVKKGLEVGTGITANSDGVDVTGIVTATQFKGDGSGLTGVTGSGSGVIVKDEGSAVGTAGTINFVGSGVAASLSAGTATVTISGGGGGTLSNIVEDTTPQLGGNLDLNSKIINGSGNIDYTGNLKASGVSTATGGSVFGNIQAGVGTLNATIQKTDNGTLHLQYNKPGNLELCQGGGQVQVKNNFNVAGLSTMTGGAKLGNLSVGYDSLNVTIQPVSGQNTLHFNYNNGTEVRIGEGQTRSDLIVKGDIEPKTNSAFDLGTTSVKWRYLYADSANITGIATFTSGVAKLFFSGTEKLTTTVSGITVPHINVSGIGTFGTRVDVNGLVFGTNATTFAAKFPDGAVSNFGTGNDLQISHANDVSLIRDARAGAGATLAIGADKLFLRNKDGNENYLEATDNGSVKLFYDFSPKFETDQAGVIITGVATATSFSGSGAGLTNIPSAQLSGALPALDGSALTGVTASGTGIIIKHDGSTVGTAGTINFSTNLDVSAISAGIVTVTASGSGGVSLSGSTNNTVATVTGANALIGEANLTYNGSTLAVGGSSDAKLLLTGSSAPYIRFQEGTTNKAYVQWQPDGYLALHNEEDSSRLRIKDALDFSDDGSTFYTVWHAGNDGASSTLDADLLDGEEGSYYTNASNLGSGTIPNGRFPATLPATSGANLTNLPVPTQITVADESSDTSCNVLFSTAATGDLAPKSGTNLTFNSANGTLTATTFVGALTGNATSADTIDITNDGSANTTFYPTFVANAGSGKTLSLDTGLTYVPSSNILTAGTFSGSGASLTNLNGSNIASGTIPIARVGDNTVTFAKLENIPTTRLVGRTASGTGDASALTAAEVRTLINVEDGATAGITTAQSNVQVTYTVTANGSSAYRFAGHGVDSTEDDPNIYLIRGQKYRFVNNSGGSHPFQIRSAIGGSAYSTGVTNNGGASGNIDFAVPYDAPANLFYQCTSHGGMVGNFYIRGGASVVTWETTKQLKLGDNTSTSVNSANLVNIDLGGTHHDTAGASGKLKLWKDASDEMSLGVSSSQMDFILTSSSYSYNFYGGSGVTRLMQLNQTGSNQLLLGDNNAVSSASPLTVNLGGTFSGSAGNGNDLSAKLKMWTNGTDLMGFSVSGNQLDYIVTSENYDHVFYGGNAGTTELARFEGTGDLKFPNGKGINFGATEGSGATTSVLEDYEEGIFTPTLSGGTSDINMHYTKIGRVVHISGSLAFSSVSGSGTMAIGGLPYTSINTLDSYTHLAAHAYDSLNVSNTTYQFQTLRVDQNSTTMRIIIPAGNGNVRTFGAYSHLSGSTFRFRVAGYYITA